MDRDMGAERRRLAVALGEAERRGGVEAGLLETGRLLLEAAALLEPWTGEVVSDD